MSTLSGVLPRQAAIGEAADGASARGRAYPGAGAALKGESASGPETTAGTPGRRSSAPLVWAAGSAVLGVLLFFSALTQFVTANLKLLWQIVLVAAILGVLTGAFERPLSDWEPSCMP